MLAMDGLNRVCFLTLVCVISSCWAFTYTCYPDDTITVEGLGDANAVFAMNSEGTQCSVTTPVGGSASITGCDKDKFIVFSFGTYSEKTTNLTVGSKDVLVVNITCNEITPTSHQVSAILVPSINYNDTAGIEVTYTVSSSLDKYTAVVGESVVWTIYYPKDYVIDVSECTANPGTTYNVAPPSTELIRHYCSQQADLISDFTTTPGSGIATATIKAFTFFGNDNVYLYCDLTVCATADACVTACLSDRRRKRQADMMGGSENGVFKSQIGQVLRIIDPNANGAIQSASITVAILIMFASLL